MLFIVLVNFILWPLWNLLDFAIRVEAHELPVVILIDLFPVVSDVFGMVPQEFLGLLFLHQLPDAASIQVGLKSQWERVQGFYPFM